jgi:hypothetical protein
MHLYISMPIPVAVRSKAWVCGRSLTGIVGTNPTGGHGCLSLVSVVCCQVEVSATSWSLVQRSPTERGVSKGPSSRGVLPNVVCLKCDREASTNEAA